MATQPFVTLQEMLDRSAGRLSRKTALEEPGQGEITYGDLAALSDRLRDRLVHLGVRPGDRVGLYLRKSIDAVASIFGALKTGAAYVPVDPGAPPARCAYILNNCTVRVIITERRLEQALREELGRLGQVPPLVLLSDDEGIRLGDTLDALDGSGRAPTIETAIPGPESLAYILYTSGSTGKPKGVMLSQQAAVSFVDWCSESFEPREDDRFSSHAPFHFDLSILDIYVPLKHGATLVLIGEEIGKEPLGLAALIAERRITSWYSTPSILSFLAQYGKLERHDYSPLRTVLFAGEVFPVPQLRAVKVLLPRPRFFNLYGPTETNVCTYHEIPAAIPANQIEPFPIGQTCSHLESKVIDLDGSVVPRGEEGELCIHGPGVMDGYWNLPEQTANSFLTDESGRRWYRTGDLVVEDENGVFIFHGRRDRMVKRRGYRVELGEIEACLATHPLLSEVAVVALPDQEAGVKIRAYLSAGNGQRPSVIALKQFCVDGLPRYMVPDTFHFLPTLPRTSTDKTDYQTLKGMG